MMRVRARQRLANALPAVVVALGAGLTAARKLRADRRARQEVRDRAAAESQAPGPPAPADARARGSGSSLTLAETVDEIGSVERAESSATLAAAILTPAEDAAAAPSGPAAEVAAGDLVPPVTGRGPRGSTTKTVIEALATGGTMTAAEVALATGIGRSTISSTLSRLTRTGQVAKGERGYRLAPDGPNSGAAPDPPVTEPRAAGPRSTAPRSTDSPRTGSGATKAKVLAALSTESGLTAGEVAAATGLGRGTVSTTLSRLAKNGEVVKADRGYRLPG